MFENVVKFLKKFNKKEKNTANNSKDAAKERLHLVLMQDRANVSADFLELMKQEIIEVIKKYIEVDEGAIDVRLTNKENEDGTNGAPALYANIPILNIKNEARKIDKKENKQNEEIKDESKKEENPDKKEIANKQNENKSEKSNSKTENKPKEENSKTEENKKEKKESKENKETDSEQTDKIKNEEKKETKSDNNKTKKVKSEKKEKVKTEE